MIEREENEAAFNKKEIRILKDNLKDEAKEMFDNYSLLITSLEEKGDKESLKILTKVVLSSDVLITHLVSIIEELNRMEE